jgi:poly(A) polymerase
MRLSLSRSACSITRLYICILQLRLPRYGGKRAHKIYQHIKFRAAFDFLALRSKIEQTTELVQLTQWWEEYQEHHPLPKHNYSRKIKRQISTDKAEISKEKKKETADKEDKEDKEDND